VSATKHTPGPLHVAGCKHHPAGTNSICTQIRTADGKPVEQTMANLTLWAVAPDMAEWMKTAPHREECSTNCAHPSDDPDAEWACDCGRDEILKKAGVL
jgi:hypothetical protein